MARLPVSSRRAAFRTSVSTQFPPPPRVPGTCCAPRTTLPPGLSAILHFTLPHTVQASHLYLPWGHGKCRASSEGPGFAQGGSIPWAGRYLTPQPSSPTGPTRLGLLKAHSTLSCQHQPVVSPPVRLSRPLSAQPLSGHFLSGALRAPSPPEAEVFPPLRALTHLPLPASSRRLFLKGARCSPDPLPSGLGGTLLKGQSSLRRPSGASFRRFASW